MSSVNSIFTEFLMKFCLQRALNFNVRQMVTERPGAQQAATLFLMLHYVKFIIGNMKVFCMICYIFSLVESISLAIMKYNADVTE